MKKQIMILPLVALMVGCVAVRERHVGLWIEVGPPDAYAYHLRYSRPYLSYHAWIGFNWMNPFWYYGLYASHYSFWSARPVSYPGAKYVPSLSPRRTVSKNELKQERKAKENRIPASRSPRAGLKQEASSKVLKAGALRSSPGNSNSGEKKIRSKVKKEQKLK